MENKKKFYITTAIAYTSRKPHIGNSYEIVLTDAIARYKRLQGYDVFFLTGTDEHGQKIEKYAEEMGIEPKAYVDKVAGEIKEVCDNLNTSYDKFIRTTDDYHEKAVQKIFERLYEQGDIYKGKYEGWYCVADEAFWTDSQVKDCKCPECGKTVVRSSEEAYFFKLSKYQKQLEKYIEENDKFIYPEARKNEMLNNFIKPGLQDLCVSRSSFKWGIPVSFDKKHVVYVWIDALSNYITALGYTPEKKGELYKKYWPADVHIIGKDIVRFHTIYWPIMLMALGEPLPKQVYGHPWLLFGTDKMSKSTGNVIYADDLIKLFGVDAVRYYLLAEMPNAQDGSITYESFISRYNSDLANTLGNLVSRTVAMENKYFGGVVFNRNVSDLIDIELFEEAEKTVTVLDKYISEYKISDALHCLFLYLGKLNKYIDETAPWVLSKDETKRERLETVLYNLLEGIRISAVLLKPFIPETADKIFEAIGTDVISYDSIKTFGGLKNETKVKESVEPLFKRIDGEKLIEELIAMQKENQNNEKKLLNELKSEENPDDVAKITFEDFSKVHIRCAEVLSCEKIEKSKKLLKLILNDGTGIRTVCSGIAKWYKPEDLVGKKILVAANLKPAVLAGQESNGMVLSAEGEEYPVVVFLSDEVPIGALIK